MKIAVRCIYYMAVTPNFLVVDLPDDKWRTFLWNRNSRIDIIRPYLKCPGASIREIAWIPLEGMSEAAKNELKDAIDDV